jgi:hypothetical protein
MQHKKAMATNQAATKRKQEEFGVVMIMLQEAWEEAPPTLNGGEAFI